MYNLSDNEILMYTVCVCVCVCVSWWSHLSHAHMPHPNCRKTSHRIGIKGYTFITSFITSDHRFMSLKIAKISNGKGKQKGHEVSISWGGRRRCPSLALRQPDVWRSPSLLPSLHDPPPPLPLCPHCTSRPDTPSPPSTTLPSSSKNTCPVASVILENTSKSQQLVTF